MTLHYIILVFQVNLENSTQPTMLKTTILHMQERPQQGDIAQVMLPSHLHLAGVVVLQVLRELLNPLCVGAFGFELVAVEVRAQLFDLHVPSGFMVHFILRQGAGFIRHFTGSS